MAEIRILTLILLVGLFLFDSLAIVFERRFLGKTRVKGDS